MKEAIIITAFCDNEDKQEIIYKLVCDLNLQKDFFIVVASHTPISDKTQQLCDIVFYDTNNVVDFSKGYTHGAAESMLIEQALFFLKYYGYEWTFKIPYDCIISNTSIFQKWKQKAINGKEFVTSWWSKNNFEVGTFGWYSKVSFMDSVFTKFRTVDSMLERGFNIEKAWGTDIIEKGVIDKVYFYNNTQEMFEDNIINVWQNGGTLRKSI
jgi:hypothetical protein